MNNFNWDWFFIPGAIVSLFGVIAGFFKLRRWVRVKFIVPLWHIFGVEEAKSQNGKRLPSMWEKQDLLEAKVDEIAHERLGRNGKPLVEKIDDMHGDFRKHVQLDNERQVGFDNVLTKIDRRIGHLEDAIDRRNIDRHAQ